MKTNKTNLTSHVIEAVTEATKNVLAHADAKKAAKALKEKQRREANKSEQREKKKAEIAKRSADSAMVIPTGFDPEKRGNTLDNCYRILAAQPWGFAYNEFSLEHEFRGDVIWPAHYGRELNSALILAIRLSMIDVYNVEFTTQHVEDALSALCRANPYNPVIEYLDSLEWDGVERLDRWLTVYLSAEDTEYTRAVGRLWMMAAVARIKVPGIKFDSVPIIEGPQGTQKSTAFKVLGGAWFSDSNLGDVKDKDAAILLSNVWIQELAELATMRRSDVGELKAFFSRATDRFRAPFERRPSNHPRSCVFVATDNAGKERGYLQDETGNRRMWPVKTGKINLVDLKRDRDQLWAEAVVKWVEAIKPLSPEDHYRAIELPQSLWATAAEEQKARLLVDPWVDQVKPWLDDPFHEREADNRLFDGRRYGDIIEPYMTDSTLDKIHSRVIMAECLHIPPGSQTKEHGRKLRAVMSTIGGWEYSDNLRVGKLRGIGGYRRIGGESSTREAGVAGTDAGEPEITPAR